MKIDKIMKTKNGKYKIIFDNKDSLITHADIILNNGILFKKQLTTEDFNKINSENQYYDIYDKTVKFISIKMRSLKEVITFLDKKTVNIEEKNRIINKLKEMNLINDKRFAKAYFQDRINLSNDGPLKIKQELKHNDIDEDIIEEIYSNFDLDTVYEKLDKLIQKKVRINRNKSNFILKQKIFNEMINLGYDKSMIANIVDKNLKENNYIINNEYIKLKNRLSRKYSGSELEERITLKLYQKGFSWDEINSIKNKEDF